MNRAYRNADMDSYINHLMAKVMRVLNVQNLPNGSLLVLAMKNNIDLDDEEFNCADKEKIRSDLESDWVYSHERFYRELRR